MCLINKKVRTKMKLIYSEFNQLCRPWLAATEIYGYLTIGDEFGRSKKFRRRRLSSGKNFDRPNGRP